MCRSVLRLGLSRPWREAMRLMTGQREFDARPILDYFEPLINWLRTKNTGHHVGWQWHVIYMVEQKNNAAFECSRLKISLIATSLSIKKSAKLASPYLFIYLYTSLFARKAAATSERSTKHTTTKTNKQKRKNYAQIGRTSEQCYHIYTPTNLFIAGQFLLQWRHCDVDWFVANGDVVSHVKM